MPYLNHNTPNIACLIRNEYLFNHESGHGKYTPCNIHSVASLENRVPLFEAFLENGVNWTRRPLSAFCWKPCDPLPLEELVYWDCFSPYIDVSIRSRLRGLRAKLITPSGAQVWGEYLFTLDWGWENKGILDTNFSETSEHKCGHIFKMDSGHICAYPNNRIIWHDKAWSDCPITKNPGYKIDTNIYSVENASVQYTDDHYMTAFTSTPELLNENI